MKSLNSLFCIFFILLGLVLTPIVIVWLGIQVIVLFFSYHLRRRMFWLPKCVKCNLPAWEGASCYQTNSGTMGNPICQIELTERPGWDSPAIRYKGFDQ